MLRRRTFVVRSVTVLAAPVLGLGGCAEDDEPPATADTGGDDTAEGSTGCCDSDPGSTSTGGMATSETAGTSTTAAETTSGGPSTTGDDGSTGDVASTGDDDSTGSDGSTGSVACEPSPSDIEGPFYRPGIPIGGDLDIHGDDGVPLALEGRVLDGGCQPIPSAVVEIWHATPVAAGGVPGDVNATYDGTAQYRYYGQVATDDQGRFSFTTLRPGWYLNGNAYRPAHVHLKVWVGGVERLTTQLYFTGDPFNAQDPWFNPVMALDPAPNGQASIEIIV